MSKWKKFGLDEQAKWHCQKCLTNGLEKKMISMFLTSGMCSMLWEIRYFPTFTNSKVSFGMFTILISAIDFSALASRIFLAYESFGKNSTAFWSSADNKRKKGIFFKASDETTCA